MYSYGYSSTVVTHLFEAVAVMIEKRSLNVKCLDLLIRELYMRIQFRLFHGRYRYCSLDKLFYSL